MGSACLGFEVRESWIIQATVENILAVELSAKFD